MSKKWIAINLLLLAVAGALARQLYVSVLRFNAENDLAKIQPVRDMKQKMTQEKPLPKMAPAKKYVAADFAVIPEKNIFAESRSKEDKVEETAPPEPPPLTQKPILVGITISGTQRMAAIIDPAGSPQNQNRRAQNKRIGDVYHGYTITDITSDRIVLESGTRKEIIPLHEGSKRSRGGKTSVVATRVVSIGTGGGGGSIPAQANRQADCLPEQLPGRQRQLPRSSRLRLRSSGPRRLPGQKEPIRQEAGSYGPPSATLSGPTGISYGYFGT
jgi:hypothetical protein